MRVYLIFYLFDFFWSKNHAEFDRFCQTVGAYVPKILRKMGHSAPPVKSFIANPMCQIWWKFQNYFTIFKVTVWKKLLA